MTSRTTRTTSRTIRTLPISSPPLGGLLICMVLMVLEVVLVVLEVTGPPVPWGKFQIRMSLRPGLYSPAPPIDPKNVVLGWCWALFPVWGLGTP